MDGVVVCGIAHDGIIGRTLKEDSCMVVVVCGIVFDGIATGIGETYSKVDIRVSIAVCQDAVI